MFLTLSIYSDTTRHAPLRLLMRPLLRWQIDSRAVVEIANSEDLQSAIFLVLGGRERFFDRPVGFSSVNGEEAGTVDVSLVSISTVDVFVTLFF